MRYIFLDFNILIFLLFKLCNVYSEFTLHFSNWLVENFGEDVRNHLERKDLGPGGSFGGKDSSSDLITKQPVIFVHGVSNKAGDKMKQAADFFYKNGNYKFSELYATTYANGDEGDPLKWMQYSMKCEYVKLVRALIVTVRLYTGRAVDVISYSLGVPISRKAILGGRCVDTNEDLGLPLTKFVDTFVGVAGPNHGISLQVGGLSIPGCVLSLLPICNAQTGLFSGMCPIQSSFLQNINHQMGYEGQYRFTIYSTSDAIVGYTVCNKITSRIEKQTNEKVFFYKNHNEIFVDTFYEQMNMVEKHIVV